MLVLLPPLLTSNPFLLHLAITVLLWTLLGAAWNLLGGFAGQVSFGHSTFFGVGAYTTMILYLKGGLAPWYGMVLDSGHERGHRSQAQGECERRPTSPHRDLQVRSS